MSTAVVRGTQEQEESFGDKLKKLFVRPTATPKHRKKKKASPAPTTSPSPSASETPVSSMTPLPQASATLSATPSEAPSPTVTATATVATETRPAIPVASPQTQYFEPVRPITPGPHSRRRATPKTTPPITSTITATPIPTQTPTPTPAETPVSRPMPSLPPMIKPAVSPTPFPIFRLSPPPSAKKTGTPTATIPTTEIADSQSYSPEVKKVIDLGLNLMTQNLSYKIN